MKKALLLLLVLLTSITIVSCTKNEVTIDKAIEEIRFNTEVNSDFELPTSIYNYKLEWQTTSENLLIENQDTNKVLIKLVKETNVVTATLTLIISNSYDSKVKNYTITISSLPSNEEKVSVSYYDGNTLIESINYKYNTLAIEKSDYNPEGYSLEGWFTDKKLTIKYDFNTPLLSNLTLYAKLIKNPITDSEMIDSDLDNLSTLDFSTENEKIDLPLKGKYNSKIVWQSNNPKIISDQGFIFYPSERTVVKLTATLTLKNFKKTFSKDITVDPFSRTTNLNLNSKKLDFKNLETTFNIPSNRKIDTYYLNDGLLPYVDVQNFFESLNGFILYDKLRFDYQDDYLIKISYNYNSSNYLATIDFKSNTITTQSLTFFDYYTIEYDGISYDNYGITDKIISSTLGDDVLFNLNKYNVNTFIYKDSITNKSKFLIPYHFANHIFTGSSYYNTYYNGDEYYGFYETPEENSLNEVKKSSLNNQKITDDVLYSNYNMLAFLFDNYYGLVDPETPINDYYDILVDYQDDLLVDDSNRLSQNIANFLYKEIDDLHTSFAMEGYYNSSSYTISYDNMEFGERQDKFYSQIYDIEDLVNQKHDIYDYNGYIDYDKLDNMKTYRFLDTNKTTAVIFLYEFLLDESDVSSKGIIRDALQNIYKESSNTKNIVLDLSINGGGHVGAVFDVLGFMTSEAVTHTSFNPLTNSSLTYSSISDMSSVPKSVLDKSRSNNWYILSTIGTFSSANATVALAKEYGYAKIIGEKSGGGASSIQPVVLVDGSIIYISSLDVITFSRNNKFVNIEYGVEPDINLNHLKIQDDKSILNAILNN
ncbi:S41 family peptidase [Haploplasma axanthum]|uniref:Transmembrane protein and tail specific protease n=1 Tax=Haploplasma axanthum TaxID=29552 RepID=A0A449BE99_HAPAX|nr:S41 family peptidase [Haploplasma axanthum]VEU80779.1 transmembrane protein and tail specific protease [Haploplasma axanthum]